MMRLRPGAGVALAVAALFSARTAAHDPITTHVTWSREISRIVEARCAGCHRPGGIAPMPLLTYQDSRPWAKAIADVTMSRRMPPWGAARGVGEFANDPTLSPFEIALISSWANGGAPEGLPGHRVSLREDRPKRHSMSWHLKFPRRTIDPAGGSATFSAPVRFDRDRWLVGWRFLPNDAAIVSAEFRLASGAAIGDWTPQAPKDDIVWLAPDTGLRVPMGAIVGATFSLRGAQAQQDFPLRPPARAPELELMLTAARPAREHRIVDVACRPQPIGIDGADLIAVRPITAHAGGSIGLAVATPGAAPDPILFAPRVDPAYTPTYYLKDGYRLRPRSTLEVRTTDPDCALRLTIAQTVAAPGTRTPF